MTKQGVVLLEKGSGAVVKLPLAKFIESDQALFTKHFKIGEMAPNDVALAEGLAHPKGEIAGPIDTGKSSSFHL